VPTLGSASARVPSRNAADRTYRDLSDQILSCGFRALTVLNGVRHPSTWVYSGLRSSLTARPPASGGLTGDHVLPSKADQALTRLQQCEHLVEVLGETRPEGLGMPTEQHSETSP
jgi:hypothetical protein